MPAQIYPFLPVHRPGDGKDVDQRLFGQRRFEQATQEILISEEF